MSADEPGIDPEVSIISSNCLGALVAHDFGLRFNSPTVNLYMEAPDFIDYLQHLDEMIDPQRVTLEDITAQSGESHPVVLLNGRVRLHLLHYGSFEEGRVAYLRRCERVNRDKLRVIMTERDGCSTEHLRAFDALDFPAKVVFMKQHRPEIGCGVYVPGDEEKSELNNLMERRGLLRRKPYRRVLDWRKFLTTGEIDSPLRKRR